MSKFLDRIHILKALSSEGNYSVYKLQRSKKSSFLFLKHLYVTWQYSFCFNDVPNMTKAAFIKGNNQERLHREALMLVQSKVGLLDGILSQLNKGGNVNKLPSFGVVSLLLQVFYLCLFLVTNRKRFLNLYYLEFYDAVRILSEKYLYNLKVFVCYNDRPFDTAAFVIALKRKKIPCRTIVFQHGLITPKFNCFPMNADEFWSWGCGSKLLFKSRNPYAKFIVTGRSSIDKVKKSNLFLEPNGTKILISPSHNHAEVKNILKEIFSSNILNNCANLNFFIKLHPATKNKFILRLWIKKNFCRVTEVKSDMTVLADEMDFLYTLNSSSALDFLLVGKLVFFSRSDSLKSSRFPSMEYGYSIEELQCLVNKKLSISRSKEEARLNFLFQELNV